MKLTDEQKQNHRRGCRLLAALAVEHGLRLLSVDDPARKLIEEDIRIVREGSKSNISRRYALAKKRTSIYGVGSELLCASKIMLSLARQQSLLEGFWFGAVYCRVDEAAKLVKDDVESYGKECLAEYAWQKKNLYPLEEGLFRDCGESRVVEDVVNFKEAS